MTEKGENMLLLTSNLDEEYCTFRKNVFFKKYLEKVAWMHIR